MAKLRISRFWTVVVTLGIIYSFIKWAIPAISREITTLPFPLPVPGTLVLFYMVLVLLALFMFVSFSDEYLEEFLNPVNKLLRGEYTKVLRLLVLVAVPVIAGWQVYEITVPKVEAPVALRIQHPSSNFPKKFESLKNPVANPTDAAIEAFIQEAKANKVSLIPQLMPDVERWLEWMEENDMEVGHMLEFFTTEPMKTFLSAIKTGNVDKETARAALLEKTLFEGRALYAMNCRACHGDSVAGDGPMADGFKLRPINFTDNGTIETIVEGYTFWRVMNGGPGLPTEATPWDSAMPEWKLNLTEEERWKIIMAEYDLAEKTPRIPESHE
ncbi:MAG: cytochrome c [Gammaproteobacteria bacterium]|nr:cytochrome c [Gammaproteobacteria bacterium]